MTRPFEDYIRSFNILTDKEIAISASYLTPLSLKRNEFFIREGEVCNRFAFVVSGVLRNFYLSNTGEDVTHCLSFPGKLINAYSSFITRQKTFENIHAVSDTELLVMQRNDYEMLVDSSRNWLLLSKTIAEQTYLEMERRLLILQMQSAEKRYHDLITNYPDYLQEIPLKYLASYLGITQRHLSRLRSSIRF